METWGSGEPGLAVLTVCIRKAAVRRLPQRPRYVFAQEEPLMTHTANKPASEPGMFRRASAAFWAFLEALESGGSGYTFDRVEHLEREVGRLKEELSQTRDPGARDASATAVEQ